MNKTIKVSVIVPVYKVEQYLDKCVESILNQSLSDFELILVDDGSPDNCPKMCDEWAKKDNRIKVIHKQNGGLSDARNAGMKIATGEYILFVDSDDYIRNDTLSLTYDKAAINNSDIVLFNICTDTNGIIRNCRFEFEDSYSGNEYIKENLLYRYYTSNNAGINSACNKLYKTAFLRNNSLEFDVNDIRCEDCWFNFKCLQKANQINYLNEYLYYYLQNPNSIMHDSNLQNYNHWVNNRKRFIKENKTLNFKINQNEFYKDFIYKVIVHCMHLISNKKCQNVNDILSDEFFIDALNYDELLPRHIKMIDFCIKKRLKKTAVFIMKVWSKI